MLLPAQNDGMVMNAKRISLKKINTSFIIHFCLGKNKQATLKEKKITEEYLRRTRKLLKISLYSRGLTKGMDT